MRLRASRHEDIADSPNGLQHLPIEVLVDLFAEPEHEDVDDVRARIEAVVPDVREDHRLRHHAPGIAHREYSRSANSRGRSSSISRPARVTFRVIRSSVRSPSDEPIRIRCTSRTADERVYAREQLGERKRLGQIVVTADLQSLHPVVDRVLRAQNDDRRPIFRSRMRWMTDNPSSRGSMRSTIASVRFGGGEMQTAVAFRRMVHGEPRLLEPLHQEAGNRQVVLDDQDTHWLI